MAYGSETVRLAKGWQDLLCRVSWDCFATLTFSHERHDLIAAFEAWRPWVFQWCQTEAEEQGLVTITAGKDGKKWGPGVKRSGPWWSNWRHGGSTKPMWVVGAERMQSGAVHLHGMIRFSDRLRFPQMSTGWKLWFYPRCQRGKIEIVKSQADVVDYVTSYIVKDYDRGELCFSDNFDQAPLGCFSEAEKKMVAPVGEPGLVGVLE